MPEPVLGYVCRWDAQTKSFLASTTDPEIKYFGQGETPTEASHMLVLAMTLALKVMRDFERATMNG